MSELIDNRARRIATLEEVIQHLHKGEAPDAVKGQFRDGAADESLGNYGHQPGTALKRMNQGGHECPATVLDCKKLVASSVLPALGVSRR